MSLFRRRGREDATPDPSDEADDTAAGSAGTGVTPGAAGGSTGPDDRAARATAGDGPRADGPWDVSEVADPASGGRVDLGGMWLPGRPELEVRIEADQATSQVVAVTLVLGDGALQVQPFAAPRTEPIWGEVRDEIRAGITAQGGTADEVVGPLGPELRTRVPVRAADGSSGVQPARFVGVDGPRWFLRGVITGRPAVEEGADAALIELLRDIVVVRGEGAMAPREPIPLSLPPVAAPADSTEAGDPEARDPEAGDPEAGDPEAGGSGGPGRGGPDAGDLRPFERGPEITEIR